MRSGSKKRWKKVNIVIAVFQRCQNKKIHSHTTLSWSRHTQLYISLNLQLRALHCTMPRDRSPNPHSLKPTRALLPSTHTTHSLDEKKTTMSLDQYDNSALAQIPSSPPKKLLPAFPAMGKFVAGETNGITHVYRDEDDVLVPGIMSSSPVKRSHVAAFGATSLHHHQDTKSSPPPSSPCARASYSSDCEREAPASSEDDTKLQLESMIQREPRTALCSLPIVNLTRPSANRVNTLIMEKRVHQSKDLLSKATAQELLAIMGEYYPPVAIGRSSLQSQVVLSKSNRQISRRHVTTWYDLERHVITISCSGWNGCRVMRNGRVFRTPENQALLEEAKLKYGDIFEPSSEYKEGQENLQIASEAGSDANRSSSSFGTFLFKNDRMEVDATEILVDVRGERFMIRLSDEGDEVADEDAEMTTDETDDEELVPLTNTLTNTSPNQLNVKRQKVEKAVEKKAVVPSKVMTAPSTPAVDKENQTPATPASKPRSAKPNNKPVFKTVKVMKPIVRQVSRPAGRLEKPQMLAEKKQDKTTKAKEVAKEVETADVEMKEVEPEVIEKVEKTVEKPVKADKVEKVIEKPVKAIEKTEKVEKTEKPTKKVVEKTEKPEKVEKVAVIDTPLKTRLARETTPVPQMSKETPKSTPRATPKSTPKRAKSPSPEVPLSPSEIDYAAIRNLVCNHLAFSRLSCTPLQTVMAVSPKISKIPKTQLREIIRAIDCIGIITREGKDASGKPLEEEYYYVPERDSDKDRVKLVNETKGGAGVRSCRKVHKQYYWKKPAL